MAGTALQAGQQLPLHRRLFGYAGAHLEPGASAVLRFEPMVQGLETANARGELRVLPERHARGELWVRGLRAGALWLRVPFALSHVWLP